MGTKKRGGASAPNTKTRLNFIRPAGKTLTLTTQKDPTVSPEVGSSAVNGAGSTAPVFVAKGFGKLSYKTEVAQFEGALIAKIAKDAGIPIMGTGGLLFDIVWTTTVDGMPKSTDTIEGCTVDKFELKISADGNMRSIEGEAVNGTVDGARYFQES